MNHVHTKSLHFEKVIEMDHICCYDFQFFLSRLQLSFFLLTLLVTQKLCLNLRVPHLDIVGRTGKRGHIVHALGVKARVAEFAQKLPCENGVLDITM